MAFELQVDRLRGVASIRYAGFVSGREIVAAIGQMLDHPDWRPGFKRFSSTVDVTTMDVTPADLEAMRRQDVEEQERIGGGRKAIVVGSRYEVVSIMYKHSIDRKYAFYELEVFRDETAAWNWLLGDATADSEADDGTHEDAA